MIFNAAGSGSEEVSGAEQRGKGVEEDYGPTINIDRVPQWGRAFESFSEDPYLDGDIAAAEVKHFAVYNQETNRNTTRSSRSAPSRRSTPRRGPRSVAVAPARRAAHM